MDWGIVFLATEDGTVPAYDFLKSCPEPVRVTILATLEAVREAPPPAFSGGGKWEAMHGSMGGYYEVRVTGPGRRHYRLFCMLDNGSSEQLTERGFDRPQIVVVNGLVKQNATLFSDAGYRKHVRRYGDDYLSTLPRPIAQP